MHLHPKALVAVLILGTTFFQQLNGSAKESAEQSELVALEAVWNTAHLNGDADTLDKLWADDLLVIVTSMPVMTKADALGFMRSGRMKFQHYETSDIQVRIYGEAAVVTGRLARTRTINGQILKDDWRFTKVYTRQSGKWRVVSFHASTTS